MAHASEPATIDDQRYPSARGQTAVDERAHQSAGARGRQQDTVAATAEPERLRGVHDELHGLGSVGEFDHRHDHDQPQRERGRAHRPQPLGQLGNPGRTPAGRSRVGTHRRDQQRRDCEGRAVRRKRDPGGGHCEQDRSDRRADEDAEILDRVQERVCRAEPDLTDQAREERHRRRLLRAPSGRRQGGERDDQRHRASAGDRRSDGGHEQHPQGVTGQQYGAPWIAVGDGPPERAQQHVRENLADRRGANPARRVGRAVHVSEQRGVVQPITDLRGGAGPDQRAGARDSQDVSIRPGRRLTHRVRVRIPLARVPSPRQTG